jgi:hypothetical protein
MLPSPLRGEGLGMRGRTVCLPESFYSNSRVREMSVYVQNKLQMHPPPPGEKGVVIIFFAVLSPSP